MNISTIKTMLGLGLGGLAISGLTACTGQATFPTETVQVVAWRDPSAGAAAPDVNYQLEQPVASTEDEALQIDYETQAGDGNPALNEPAAQQDPLEMLATTLNANTQVAIVRTGPGLKSDVIGRTDTNSFPDLRVVRAQIDPSAAAWICQAQPIRGFGTVWHEHPEVRNWLGCPFSNFRRGEHATQAAVQSFEHGWMLWLETDTVQNIDPIYVFFEDDGSFIRYGDRDLADAHSYAQTPQGFYKVGDRFAKVYWEEIGMVNRGRLGHAVNEARDSLGAFQEFQNGRMFWAGEADTIYVIYQGNYDLNNDGRSDRIQGWLEFEDNFADGDP